MGTPRTGVRGPGTSPGRFVSRNGLWRGVAGCWLERAADPLWLLRDGGCVREGVARRQGRRWNRVWMGGDFPAVAGKLAGDRDRDDRVGLFAGVFELAPARVEASLRFPGDVDDLRRLAALATLELDADAGLAAVVVGGLDQQPAGVAGPRFGDRPLAALLACGVLG